MKYVEQEFILTIELQKDCRDKTGKDDIANWFEEFMDGCDIGDTKVSSCEETGEDLYKIIARLKAECDERLTEDEVKDWFDEHSEGSDMGELTVIAVLEVTK